MKKISIVLQFLKNFLTKYDSTVKVIAMKFLMERYVVGMKFVMFNILRVLHCDISKS